MKSERCIVLDVRTVAEHDDARLACPHHHVPLDQLSPLDFMQGYGFAKDMAVFILCHVGGRARRAAALFIEQGYPNAIVIEGGILACDEAGQALEGRSVV
jgi:rhodanese-related sulfurtransferase